MVTSAGDEVGHMLRICTRTWTRDSHDLFDYETHDSKQLAERHFASSHGFRLLRSHSSITAITTATAVSDIRNNEQEVDHLLTIVCRNPGEYILSPAERIPGQSLIPQRLWLVVRALPDKRYALQENDIIKLGRYRLRVRRIVPENELANFDVTTLLDFPVPEVSVAVGEAGSLQCRICLAEGTDEEKLLCLCECKGSIKYVHAECMRRWIHLRSLKDTRESDQPLKATLVCETTCELCKAHLPPFVRLEGQLIPLVMMPDLTSPFILLENVTPHASKGLHFISVPASDFVRLGRGHDASVRIADVSISRNHATIFYEDGTFFLEDHDSKFGTLVALRRPVAIAPNETTAVQVGRSLIEFSIDPSLRFISGCVDIPPLSDCFKFCAAVDRMEVVNDNNTPVMSVSAMNTPMSVSHEHDIDDSGISTAEGYAHPAFLRDDGSYPLILGFADHRSFMSRGNHLMSMQMAENSPLNHAENLSARQSAYAYSPMYARHYWDSIYTDESNPSFMHGGQTEDIIGTVPTNDGVAYLRLIMNTPSRNHILRNLHYHSSGIPHNRIIPPSDLPYSHPAAQQPPQVTSPPSSFEESGNSHCFLPDNAFMNVDGIHGANGNESSSSAQEGGRLTYSPASDNVRGLMRWMPLGSNPGPTMQPPK